MKFGLKNGVHFHLFDIYLHSAIVLLIIEAHALVEDSETKFKVSSLATSPSSWCTQIKDYIPCQHVFLRCINELINVNSPYWDFCQTLQILSITKASAVKV